MTSIAEAVSLAIQHHVAGRLEDAEALYRQILGVQPFHIDVRTIWARCLRTRPYCRSREMFPSAIALKPDYAQALNNLGLVLCSLDA